MAPRSCDGVGSSANSCVISARMARIEVAPALIAEDVMAPSVRE
jgi:hypothetical protein